jgi:hypothetical protein
MLYFIANAEGKYFTVHYDMATRSQTASFTSNRNMAYCFRTQAEASDYMSKHALDGCEVVAG